MSRVARIACRVLLALAGWGAPAGDARAQQVGVVWIDLDADGVRDPNEPGRPGVVVTNGREVVRTDAAGRYQLPAREAFTSITRPDGFESEIWARRGGGDFALVLRTSPDDLFFVQISDAHVYDRPSDFAEFSVPIPDWLPRAVSSRVLLAGLASEVSRHTSASIARGLRRALESRHVTAGMSDAEVTALYMDQFANSRRSIGDVEGEIRETLAEIAALRPDFVVSTGDLVLEGNRATPEAVERWLDFYLRLTRGSGLAFYHTIGNNELAGTENDDFSRDDPRFGKGAYESAVGPTTYSFDRGDVHFVALDTHRPEPALFDADAWTFVRMERDVQTWLERDLAAHAERTLVVLNHEPFHADPNWSGYEPADDAGLFAEHGVDYVLAGHLHKNGGHVDSGTEHITTGSLSGLRWVLPASLAARGYRLLYLHGDRLFHGWKETGRPVVDFVGSHDGELVVLAADRAGPFRSVEAYADDRPLAVRRWGDYFLRVTPPAGRTRLRLVAEAFDGRKTVASLRLP